MFAIVPTQEQLQLLAGPKTIASVKAADFLARQEYIDEWIRDWLGHCQWPVEELPLCISESIICDHKLKRVYKKALRAAVIRNDALWINFHAVVPLDVWSVADFAVISDEVFDLLWEMCPVPFKWCVFVAQSRRMYFWQRFVDTYGPTETLRDAVQQFWSDGTAYCLAEGADITSQDFVKLCVRNEAVFRQITFCNPPATQEAWEEFLLQRSLKRVKNVPLVEEWFWIHGYRIDEPYKC